MAEKGIDQLEALAESGPGSDDLKAGVSNFYVALESSFQQKIVEIISQRISLNSKKPHLTNHLAKRLKNAIWKSFYFVVRRCDVSLADQTSGKFFKTTYQFVKRSKQIDDLIKGFRISTKLRKTKEILEFLDFYRSEDLKDQFQSILQNLKYKVQADRSAA